MRRLVASAVVMGALSVGSFGVRAEASGELRVVRFDNETHAGPVQITGSSCDADNNCVLSYTVTTQVSGDFQGTLSQDGMLYAKAGVSTFQFSGLGIFAKLGLRNRAELASFAATVQPR